MATVLPSIADTVDTVMYGMKTTRHRKNTNLRSSCESVPTFGLFCGALACDTFDEG
jgi:hypothetical protein